MEELKENNEKIRKGFQSVRDMNSKNLKEIISFQIKRNRYNVVVLQTIGPF